MFTKRSAVRLLTKEKDAVHLLRRNSDAAHLFARNTDNLILKLLPLHDEEPGLRCPEWSGDILVLQVDEGDNVGLLLFVRPALCLTMDDIGIVALRGPCFVKFGEDFKVLVVAPWFPDIFGIK